MVRTPTPFLKRSYPFADKFVIAVSKILGIISLLTQLFAIIYCLWISWALTEKLRGLLDNNWWSVLIYIVATGIVLFLGVMVAKFWPRLVSGPPTFEQLGGLPLQTMAAVMGASQQIEIELSPQDKPVVQRFNEINNHILHDTLKGNFQNLRYGATEDEMEAEWKNIWKTEILDMQFNGYSIEDAMDTSQFGLTYSMSAVLRSTAVAHVIENIFWIIMVLIIYLFASQRMELLTGVQIGVAIAILFAGFWYMYVLNNLSAIPVTFQGLILPQSVRDRFQNDIDQLEGAEIRPKKVKINPKFYQAIRNYQMRLLSGAVLSDILLLLLLFGAICGIIYLIDAEYARTLKDYNLTIVYGVLIAGIGVVLSFYLFAVVLQNFRKLGAALIVAVLSAGLPFVIDYLLGGQLDMSSVKAAIFAGSGGLTAALVTAVTGQVKESME